MTRLQKFQKTKKGLVSRIYFNQIESSKRRGHDIPSYTQNELFEWVCSVPFFDSIYNNYVLSGYQKMLVPSVDRINDNLPYTFDNIQLMTWRENKDKAHRDMRIGKLTHGTKPQIPIIQYDLEGNIIFEHHSIMSASRETGVDDGNIVKVCKGFRKTAGGYKFKYK